MSTSSAIVNGAMDKAWWKSAVVYQIYPASFCDSNGDGIGDLNGITSKLDYLKALGVDVIWLSPIYQSPMVDMGYDISDYRQINSSFGTMSDFDRLLQEVHRRDMKLVQDLVVNHTSDEHPWFVESRKIDSPKRDWYIWKPARYDADGKPHPPNNWKASLGGGSVWEWDEESQEYYLHLYDKKQPDLNFETLAVREAVYDVMRFWLDKGIDGYRMDVIGRLSKDQAFPDAEVRDKTSEWQEMDRSKEGPRIHEFIQEMHREVLSKYDMMTVGELPGISMENMKRWTHPDRHELQMGFTFDHVNIGLANLRPIPQFPWSRHVVEPWTLPELKSILANWQTMREAGCWHALYLENHDQPRSISRFADDSPQYREASGKLLALMHCTLFGTLYLYQGQEIGMINLPTDWPAEEYKDVQTQNLVKQVREYGQDVSELIRRICFKSRDGGRSPMQASWDASPNAGFTSGTPWMRIPDDYPTWNANKQVEDPKSLWAFWRDIMSIRKQAADDLVYGKFQLLSSDHPQIFAFTRNDRYLTILNFSGETVQYELPRDFFGSAPQIRTDGGDLKEAATSSVQFRPWSGALYRRE